MIFKTVKVGIVGYGMVGSALHRYFERRNKKFFRLVRTSTKINDPSKGYHDNLNDSDVLFICVNAPTMPNGHKDIVDLTNIKNAIFKNFDVSCIVIRSTVPPSTCDSLTRRFCKEIHFMPEFLSESTADEDMDRLPIVCSTDQVSELFDNQFILLSAKEGEILKYAHNVFGALKVTYFNMVQQLCERYAFCEYDEIRKSLLAIGHMDAWYTKVPGPDGKYGFGGSCFPKDSKAFQEILIRERVPGSDLIKEMISINEAFRSINQKK